MSMDTDAAYQLLLTETEDFLKTYPLMISGSPRASGQVEYSIDNRPGVTYRPGKTLGTRRWHSTEAFNIRHAGASNHAYTFNAYSIHMDTGAAAMNPFALPVAGGPDIMLTGQLSGCSFVILPGGNSIRVAHVRPMPGVAATVLRTNLVRGNPNAHVVYGVHNLAGFYDNYIRSVAVVGVRTFGSWAVYAQKLDNSPASNFDKRIRSVWQLFPEHKKI